jgi:hypothetical protein
MTEIGFDVEKIDRYFKGEYSDKDAHYIDEVLCDNNKGKNYGIDNFQNGKEKQIIF